MSIACNGERSIALTAHLLPDEDRQESQRLGEILEYRWPRLPLPRHPNLPAFFRLDRYENSTRLAFLSHFCFVSASLSYLLLAFANYAWFRVARIRFGLPGEVLDEDDDGAWREWDAGDDKYSSAVEDAREGYNARYKLLNVSGAALFVVCGTLDWVRLLDTLNVFMILAGVAGVASGLSDTNRAEVIWDCISNHLYLLEAYPMLKRDDPPDCDDEGHLFIRVGRVCFLGGCLLNVSCCYFYRPFLKFVYCLGNLRCVDNNKWSFKVLGSYVDLAGIEGLWTVFSDMLACFLWLECSLIELGAEIYFLKSSRD
jgi:hypothetical protein